VTVLDVAIPRGEWDTPEFWKMVEELRGGDRSAIEPALAFLEDDPWTFGSGRAKERVVRILARYDFTV
jgi:hypothetical protein